MAQDNRECNGMNSAFEKLRIKSDERYKNMPEELDILKPKILQAFHQIACKTDSIYESVLQLEFY